MDSITDKYILLTLERTDKEIIQLFQEIEDAIKSRDVLYSCLINAHADYLKASQVKSSDIEKVISQLKRAFSMRGEVDEALQNEPKEIPS